MFGRVLDTLWRCITSRFVGSYISIQFSITGTFELLDLTVKNKKKSILSIPLYISEYCACEMCSMKDFYIQPLHILVPRQINVFLNLAVISLAEYYGIFLRNISQKTITEALLQKPIPLKHCGLYKSGHWDTLRSNQLKMFIS